MTISLKHAFQSAKGDGTDSTLVRPSNWNAEHTITLAADKLIGRATAGTGAAEEIACTAIARQILAGVDAATILAVLGVSPPTTGDVKLTLKTVADSGWLIFDDGTFGSATSGSSQRNNSDTQNLFNLLFANLSDANAPILTSAGGATTRAAQTNAATAWAANCRMSLPKALGRALAIAGSGSGLTARTLGATVGGETNTLAANQIPSLASSGNNSISVTSTVSDVVRAPAGIGSSNAGGGANGQFIGNTATTGQITSTNPAQAISVNYTNASQQTVNNMQPSSFLNAMVKL